MRLLLALFLFFSPAVVVAQGENAPAPQARTAADAKIALAELNLRLGPLTAEDVEVEFKAWRAVFAKQAEEIAGKEIAALQADGAAKSTLVNEIAAAKEELRAIRQRADAVLVAWRDRGGDKAALEKHKKYLDAATNTAPNWLDPEAVWATVTAWLTSETGGIAIGINIVLFLVTLFVFRILSRVFGKVTERAVGRLQSTSAMLRKFTVNFVTKGITFIGLLVAVSFLGVEVGPFLAMIGAAGFIVGFALQGTLNNFAAGIMILIYHPYDVGDFVTAGGVTGKVEKMSMSSTTVKTPDNQVIMVPNGSIWGGIITNVTGSATRRVDLVFGIGYEADMARAQEILERAVAAHPLVLEDPAPVIKVHELADSSVNFVCRPWSKTGDYWDVYWDLTRTVKERFDAEGISIPFPQRDVHVHQVTA